MTKREDSSTSEKLIIGTVAIIGIVTVIFGFLHIKKSIFSPFRRDPNDTYKTPAEQEKEAMAILKTTDTDKDNLTDFDELYIFRTNPYLEDTDSDGVNDGEEINNNSDPNCPKGLSCLVPRIPNKNPSSPSGGTDSEVVGQQVDVDKEEQMAEAFIEIFGDPTK